MSMTNIRRKKMLFISIIMKVRELEEKMQGWNHLEFCCGCKCIKWYNVIFLCHPNFFSIL